MSVGSRHGTIEKKRELIMFKSILTALKPSSTQDYIIRDAVALAKRIGGELVACTVIDEHQIASPEPTPMGAGVFKKERDQELMKVARAEAARVMADCQAAASAAGVTCRTEQFDGDLVEILSRRSHEYDLVVVGHATIDDAGDESLLGRILKRAVRPTIVFPKRPAVGEGVVVAYDGSIQAARTLSSFAYSRLGIGRAIHVVSCHVDSAEAVESGEVACRFLRRHGLSVEFHAKAFADSPAAALLASIAEFSAGMLVMGAFGQSAVREFFFGSTTRTILHELPVPVFVDH
jgi:nucleotide-binding universal stress UspA family protein